MRCPKCLSDTNVTNSRLQKRTNSVWRRRKCKNCNLLLTSSEQVDYSSIMSVAHYDKLLPYSTDILFLSIYAAMPEHIRNVDAARRIASTVTSNIAKNTNNSPVFQQDIVMETLRVLYLFDIDTYVIYGAQHKIKPPRANR